MTMPFSPSAISLSQANVELGFPYNTRISLGAFNVRALADNTYVISYSVTTNSSNYNEGSVISVTINAVNIANGTVVYLSLNYINSNSGDFVNPSTQTLTINNNTVSTTITVNADATTEGSETFKLKLTNAASTVLAETGNITINDTSLTPVAVTGRGYFAGGTYWSGSYTFQYAEIDGIDFNTEATINPSATLSVARSSLTGVNNSAKGFFAGGYGLTVEHSAEIDGIIFSTEAAFNPSVTLAIGRSSITSLNSQTVGFFLGGVSASSYAITDIDALSFSTETSLGVIIAKLTMARHSAGGVQNTLKGYVAGGYDTANGYTFHDIECIHFASQTMLPISASLLFYKLALTGVNSNTKGYFVGGYYDNYGSSYSDMESFNFSTETIATTSATLSIPRSGIAGVNSTNKGYVGGGLSHIQSSDTLSHYSEIDGIDFSTEAAINPSATLSSIKADLAGVQSGSL